MCVCVYVCMLVCVLRMVYGLLSHAVVETHVVEVGMIVDVLCSAWRMQVM